MMCDNRYNRKLTLLKIKCIGLKLIRLTWGERFGREIGKGFHEAFCQVLF